MELLTEIISLMGLMDSGTNDNRDSQNGLIYKPS
jgi:hypothetical protein